MKIENTEVYGFRAAVDGSRNAMNSWDKEDSIFWYDTLGPGGSHIFATETPKLGTEDLKLLSSLVRAGPEHAKFNRVIQVWVDMELPRYIHQEMDTYKISTTKLSCSTRPPSLKKTVFTLDMFETNGLTDKDMVFLGGVINYLNSLINDYWTSNDKSILRRLKKLLPEAYIQRATFNFNYQTLGNMYHQRKNHWLDEWTIICSWIKTLPYAKELITGEE